MRLGMAIDIKRCIGCHTCSVTCKQNNNLPNDAWWNRVITDGGAGLDTARGTYPNEITIDFVPTSCQHCANPACMAVCPVEAIAKRDDGIITQDNEKCIGCQLCISACPYDARVYYGEEPEYVVDFPLGDIDAPKHEVNKVDKCTFCVNRIDRGEVPSCMEFCIARARHWGDLDDPESDISQFLKDKNATRLLEDKGTEPAVYFVR